MKSCQVIPKHPLNNSWQLPNPKLEGITTAAYIQYAEISGSYYTKRVDRVVLTLCRCLH
jgi:hypothetical protein